MRSASLLFRISGKWGIMTNSRRYPRYSLDGMELNGRIILADKLEILDISCGGIAIKVDRRLNMECEYLLRLYNNDRHISIKGLVVRSALTGTEENSEGKTVLIYTAGLKFKEDAADLLSSFLGRSNSGETEATLSSEQSRLYVRFHITTPWESVLDFPSQYRVKVISLGGMMIETEHSFEPGSTLPMELSFSNAESISFEGRVASCLQSGNQVPSGYDVGIEFMELGEVDRELLSSFIDYLSSNAY